MKILIKIGAAAAVGYFAYSWYENYKKSKLGYINPNDSIPFNDLTDEAKVGTHVTNDQKIAFIHKYTNPESFQDLVYGQGIGIDSLGLNPAQKASSLYCALGELKSKYPNEDWSKWIKAQLTAEYTLVRCMKDNVGCETYPIVELKNTEALSLANATVIAEAVKPCSAARNKTIQNYGWD